jgi:hypothetical protein
MTRPDTKLASIADNAEIATAEVAGPTGLTLVEAARQVLRDQGHPMTVAELWAEISASDLFRTDGKTPEQTLSTILRRATEGVVLSSSQAEKFFYLAGPATFGMLEWRDTDIEEDDGEDVVIHPYDPSKNNIATKLLSLDLLIRRLRHGEIDLMPDFQRKGNLWSDERMSRLVESLLIRLPLPVFYFDASDDAKWLVVDGLQRLSTIQRFVVDQDLALGNLEYLKVYEGKTFAQLPRDLQRRIEETQITAHLIAPGTPLEVKYNIFRRINTGGLVLTSQEIRHALNPGKVARFLADLAESPSFKSATSGGIPSARMLDQEFILRFSSFFLTPFRQYTVANMDSFLTTQMRDMNKAPDSKLDELRVAFEQAMLTSHAIFEGDAFRKRFKAADRRKPINKALFEVWSVALGKLSPDENASLARQKVKVRDRFLLLMNADNDFVQSITQGTGDPTRVRKRFSTIEALIAEVLE